MLALTGILLLSATLAAVIGFGGLTGFGASLAKAAFVAALLTAVVLVVVRAVRGRPTP